MTLSGHKNDWEDLAVLDPCWAVLSDSSKKFGKWDMEEFFLTGEREIQGVMEAADSLGYPASRSRVLDFGCGVGRLSRSLDQIFDRYHGVDISAEMIQKARELNSSLKNCQFDVNTRDDLSMFEDDYFDMIYTNIVLQHIPSKNLIKGYIGEFLRTLRQNGLLVFQLPAGIGLSKKIRCSTRRSLYMLLKRIGFDRKVIFEKTGLHPIRMNYIREAETTNFIKKHGGEILQIWSNSVDDGGGRCVSNTYFVTKTVHVEA